VNNSFLLDTYVSNICRQAGLQKAGICVIGGTNDWKVFVDMGLYDIDQRCDTFLDQLYYKDKTYDPILTQISDTRTFTGAVLDATKSTKLAISIVAAAFSLAENSFRNTRGSLLEALDPTTVKSIVFGRQQQIKKEIYGTPIGSKPQALHALRAYLRVCMPFTIEMEANALLTSLQRTGTAGNSPITFDASAFKATLKSTPQSRGDQTTIPPGSLIRSPGDLGTFEESMAPDTHRRFAKAICDSSLAASATDFGAAGTSTRKTIENWEVGLKDSGVGGISPNGVIDTPGENNAVLTLLGSSGPYRCDVRSAKVKNALEVALFSTAERRNIRQNRIENYLKKIADVDFGLACKAKEASVEFRAARDLDQSGDFGPASRKALAAAKACLLKSSQPPQIKQDDAFEPELLIRLP
jgi:hypothetical protein